jgi:hypothetical protein
MPLYIVAPTRRRAGTTAPFGPIGHMSPSVRGLPGTGPAAYPNRLGCTRQVSPFAVRADTRSPRSRDPRYVSCSFV